MQDFEIQTVAQVYEKLSSSGEITPELRAYLTGKLEQLLAPYKHEVEPKGKFKLGKLFGGGE